VRSSLTGEHGLVVNSMGRVLPASAEVELRLRPSQRDEVPRAPLYNNSRESITVSHTEPVREILMRVEPDGRWFPPETAVGCCPSETPLTLLPGESADVDTLAAFELEAGRSAWVVHCSDPETRSNEETERSVVSAEFELGTAH